MTTASSSNLVEEMDETKKQLKQLSGSLDLMKKNCYMVSLDLSDAYYSISISPELQKYLKFRVGHQ